MDLHFKLSILYEFNDHNTNTFFKHCHSFIMDKIFNSKHFHYNCRPR